jgi:hypothetical protein
MGSSRVAIAGKRKGLTFAGLRRQVLGACRQRHGCRRHEHFVERGGRGIAGENHGEKSRADHFEGAVAKRRAAHALGMEARGFFEDERTRANRGE